MSTPHITLVRQQLLDTLTDLRNREQPMDVDRARAVAQVASVLVDTAKVEVEYLKVTHSDRSDFLEAPPTAPQLPVPSSTPTPHNPFPTSVRHTLAG
jgi:hypothetical protein